MKHTAITLLTLSIVTSAWGQQQPLAGPLASDAEVTKASADAVKRPKSERSWVRLGDAFMQKVRETADSAYYGRAERAYEKALELNPKSAEALTGMAWVSGGRHEFEKSIDFAQKVLAIRLTSAAAYGLIGDAALEMGNYDLAFEQYQKMLDVRPDLSSYGRSAHLLSVTGETARATVLMMKAIQAGSPYAENTAWCRAQLALIYFTEGAYLPARQVLEEGLKQLPNDYRLLAAMGKVKAAMKDYPGAIDAYRKSVEIAPQQDVVASLGDLYMLTGEKDKAAQQYSMVETIYKLNKANGVTGDILTARFYADHDRNLPEALTMAEEEYKTRKNVYVADTLAWCYFKTGRMEEARKFTHEAMSRNTPEALFYFHAGMMEAKAGDRSASQLALYHAMSISPNFDPIFTPIAIKTMNELGSQPPPGNALVTR